MIAVRELTKAYGQTLAVDHISFEVPRGQIVGFLGPNGAGKSTTLKILTCYLPPTSGGATVNGFDIFHQSEQVREHLGYLPENVPLYSEMKVREYLDYRGRLRKMPRAERLRRIEYVVEHCWLGPVQHKTISHLSKGYRQRVGLADALLHNPAVLILDEPTIGLDPTQIRETRKLIKDLAGHHTVVLSTHILPEVEATCNRAIVIASGRIVAQGSPDELRASRRLTARVLVECRGPRSEVEAGAEPRQRRQQGGNPRRRGVRCPIRCRRPPRQGRLRCPRRSRPHRRPARLAVAGSPPRTRDARRIFRPGHGQSGHGKRMRMSLVTCH